ncbi:MAG: YesL family protein [Dorea sp.]|nr:YesL family protein [Dorea sp.]
MNNLFNLDGPVLQFVNKIVYSVYLNILWFICCIPVITAGASTTALFYVTLKIAKNEEGNITKAFFHSFRENLRQSTLIWLILLVLGIILGADGYILYHMRFENVFWTLCTAVFCVAAAAYAIVLMYIFPLLARFDNTVGAMFKNALFIGVRFLFCTVLMAVIYFAMLLVVVRIFTPAVIFGEGLCALLCSYLLSNVLLLCQEKTEDHADTAHLAHCSRE